MDLVAGAALQLSVSGCGDLAWVGNLGLVGTVGAGIGRIDSGGHATGDAIVGAVVAGVGVEVVVSIRIVGSGESNGSSSSRDKEKLHCEFGKSQLETGFNLTSCPIYRGS